jgi:uncharacterized protein
MKLVFSVLLGMALLPFFSTAQTTDEALLKNSQFTGATSRQKVFHAIYLLDEKDPDIIVRVLRNMNNAMNDARLAGKVKLELIALGAGTVINLKGSQYKGDLKKLIERGVIISQCNNSLIEQNIPRDSLYNFVAVVPSGNGELIIRQAEGWAFIKP